MTRQNPCNGLPLTPSQSLMWIDGQLHPTAPINNMVTHLEIRQPLDVDAFQRAFAMLVAQHEAMRLKVSIAGEQFVASVADELHPELPFLDYSTSPCGEKLLHSWIQHRCLRVFGLNECLYEAALIKLTDRHYVFFMNQHHCVTDGRSCQVMLAALDNYYSEQVTPDSITPSKQDDESRSFTEYLQWHSDHLRSEQAKTSEAYWAQRYERPPEPVRFYGHSSDIKKLSTQRHASVLSPELSKKILAGKRETPPSIVFATVLFAFLRRVTGNSDLCIAVPLLNRAQDFTTTLGLFMEISRNRLTVTEEDSFATLLEKLRGEAASIKPHRSHTITTRNGRYEAMLNYRVPADTRFGGQHASLQRIPPIALLDSIPGDEEASGEWAGRDGLEVDITHTPATGEFYVALDFNTGVWPDKDSRERSLQHFLCLLEHYFDSHTETLESLDLLTKDERQLLHTWNSTAENFAQETGIHELFEAQVARSPAAIALEFGHEQLSYHELNLRANRLAHALIRGGVQAESLVGICLHRSVDLVVALLATLKAGAAYVPLDPNYPEKRLQQVIDEAALHQLLTEESLAELQLDAGEHNHNPALASTPANLAYVIFTSGSTGRPKGVMIEQGALVNFIHAAQSVLQLTDQDRLLSVTTVSFDIFALEIFLPLVCGARMVLASDESVADGRLLAQDIDSRAITHLQATPATWHLLLDADWHSSRPFTALVGGELLTADLAEKLTSRCTELRNWYGPTEATVWASQLLIGDHYLAGIVGRPLANYRIDILDSHRRPAPIGVAGEIAIGGNSLARGYLNREDLTAEAFIHREGLDRLYRTGDLGRWTTDGEIEFLGRSDFQVKVRGYRIELGEIEVTLHTHPAITDALVVAREDSAGEKILAAYYKSEKGQLKTSDLRSYLKQSLPDYMIPSFFVLMDEFPLTPNGKIDRKALPALGVSEDQFEHSYVAAEGEIQTKMAAIWADVLGIPRVGIRDNFFDLGGHSLLALRLVSRIERETGITIPLIDLFQGKTIEEVTSQPQGTESTLPQSVVPIRSQGHLPPFFAIGSHPRYVDAAVRVNPQRPFYRLDVYAAQSVRLMLGKKLHACVDSMVTEFADHIQEIQPNGPYFIGGGCEGAQVAFGVAGELAKRGGKVEKLILWVALAPQYGAGAVFGKSAVSRVIDQLKTFLRHAQAADFKWHALAEMVKHEYIEYRIFRAMDTYRPTEVFEGEIVVARTVEDRKAWDTDLARGWGNFATGGVRVHILSGNHDTWLADYAEEFGDFLDTELSDTDARSPIPSLESNSCLEPLCPS